MHYTRRSVGQVVHLDGELLEVVDAGVQLGDEHQEVGDDVWVRGLEGVGGPGAAQEHQQERPHPRHRRFVVY